MKFAEKNPLLLTQCGRCNMRMPLFVVRMCSIALMMVGMGTAPAQDYPGKPIRIITVEAGGGADTTSRFLAQSLAGPLGQQVIVENRSGAGRSLAIEIVAKAPPDGYTILFLGAAVWLLPFQRNVSWDPIRDFSPLTLVAKAPNVLVVHPSLPVRSAQDLIALAKARPGELNYGSGGLGSNNFLAAEAFKAASGVNIVHVPYKGPGSAFIGLVSGQVQLMFPNATSAAPFLKSGKLKGLAVASAQPSELAPGLPTIASTLPGFESATNYAMFAPAKTNAVIVNRLNQEIVRILNSPETKVRFLSSGVEVVASSPEQLTAFMKSDMSRMGPIIKGAGIGSE